MSTGADGGALHGDTLGVDWGLRLHASLDASGDSQESEERSREVHCDFLVDGAEAIGSRRKKGFSSNE